eukprot:gb/GECG01015318.1/.p1 GENE.gb/GECG01015318.1/~~gb/GECG01015318.1/.p1  ORF type:complete len:132 (+),score=10.80 gb/GECG01015318.1/:1-396(+)
MDAYKRVPQTMETGTGTTPSRTPSSTTTAGSASSTTRTPGKNDRTPQSASRVKELNKTCASRISSAQVIASLPNAVKELVENALDAESTRIDIHLQNYGADCIEVTDNGTAKQHENDTTWYNLFMGCRDWN